MLQFDLDQRLVHNGLDGLTPAPATPSQRKAPARDPIQGEILGRLSGGGENLLSRLAGLCATDPALYAEAMLALQPILGNIGVEGLHAQVMQALGRNGATSSAASSGAQRRVDGRDAPPAVAQLRKATDEEKTRLQAIEPAVIGAEAALEEALEGFRIYRDAAAVAVRDMCSQYAVLSTAYTAAYERHKALLAELAEDAKDAAAVGDVIVGVATAVAVGLTAGAAVEAIGLVESAQALGDAATELVEIGIGAANDSDPGDLSPSGIAPELQALAFYQQLYDMSQQLVALFPATDHFFTSKSAATRLADAITSYTTGGEHREWEPDYVVKMSRALLRTLGPADASLQSVRALSDALHLASYEVDHLAQTCTAETFEQDLWVHWIAGRSDINTLDSHDKLLDRLKSLGIVGTWSSALGVVSGGTGNSHTWEAIESQATDLAAMRALVGKEGVFQGGKFQTGDKSEWAQTKGGPVEDGTPVRAVRVVEVRFAPTGAASPNQSGSFVGVTWEIEVEPMPHLAQGRFAGGRPAQRTAGAPIPAAGGGSGKALPGQVQAKMEQSFQTDFSAVRIHEGAAAPAIGALAYAQGQDLHFAPGQYEPHSIAGQELIGHELAHVVQQRSGRVESTGQVAGVAINDEAALESEADRMGARAARGQEALVAGAHAARAAAAATAGVQPKMAGAPIQRLVGGAGQPITLNLGGVAFQVQIPGGAEPARVEVVLNREVAGVKLGAGHLRFNDSWELEGGHFAASVVVGQNIHVADLGLEVSASGAVQASIRGRSKVGDFATLVLEATATGAGVQGEVRVTLDHAVEPVRGLKVVEATLIGAYSPTEMVVRGDAELLVQGTGGAEWARFVLQGTYKHSNGSWSVTGTLRQSSAIAFGGLAVKNGAVTIALSDGNLGPIQAKLDFDYSQGGVAMFEGDAQCTYDLAKWELSGQANVELAAPFDLGIAGARLTKAKGTVDVEKNKLKTVTGSATAQVPWDGEPTLEVSVESATYDAEPKKFSGEGMAKLLREVPIEMGPVALKLKQGEGQLVVTQNHLDSLVIRNFEFWAQTEIRGRTFTFDGTLVEGGLTQSTYGFKTRPAKLQEGLHIGQKSVELEQPLDVDVDVDGMRLTRLAVTDATVRVTGLGPDSAGEVKGSLTAELDLSTFDLNGRITASTGGFSLGSSQAKLALTEVSLTGTVEKSTLGTVTVKADAEVDVLGNNPFTLGGTVEGTYDGKKNELVSGSVTAALRGDLTLGNPAGDALVVKDGTKVAALVQSNRLTQVTAQARAQYQKKGEVILDGNIPNAAYDVDKGKLSGTGTLALKSKLAYERGKTNIWLEPGPTVTAVVTDNDLDSVTVNGLTGKLTTEIKQSPLNLTARLNSGSYKKAEGFSVNATVTLDPPGFKWAGSFLTLELKAGGETTVDVTHNSLTELNVKDLGFAARVTVRSRTLGIQGTILHGGLSDGDVSFKADPADLTTAVKIGQKSVEVVGNPSVVPDVQGSSLKSLAIKSAAIRVTGLGVGGEGVVTASITDAFINFDSFAIERGTADGKVETGFSFDAGKVGVQIRSGQIHGDVVESSLGTVSVKQADIAVSVKGKQPFTLEGQLDGEYNGKDNRVPQASLDLALKAGDVTFPAGGSNAIVLKEGSSVGATVTNNALTGVRIKKLGVELHRGGEGKLGGSVDEGHIDVDKGLVSGKATLQILGKLEHSFRKTTIAALPSGPLTAVVTNNELDSISVAGLAGTCNTTIKGQPLNLKISINSGSYDKKDGFSINTTVSLEEPGFKWENSVVSVELAAGGSVNVEVTRNALESLNIANLAFKATAKIKTRTISIDGTIESGGMSDGEVHFVADPANLLTAVKIGDRSVEVQEPVEIRPDVQGSMLKSVAIKRAAIKITGLGIAGDGIAWAELTEGFIDVDAFEITGKAAGGIEQGFSVGAGKVTVNIYTGGSLDGSVEENSLGAVNVHELKIGVTINNDPAPEIWGKLDGSYQGGSVQKVLHATVDAGVQGDLPIPIGEHKLVIKDGSKAGATVTNNAIDEVRLHIGAEYHTEEGLFLTGAIGNGVYKVEPGEVTGSGDLTLVGKMSFGAAGTTVTIGPGGSIFVDLAKSELEELKLTDIAVSITAPIGGNETTFTGKVSGTYKKDQGLVEGTASVSISGAPIVVQAGNTTVTVSGNTVVTAKVAKNELVEISVDDLNVAVATQVKGQAVACEGHIKKGVWSKAEGVTLLAGGSLAEPGLTFSTAKGFKVTLGKGAGDVNIVKGDFDWLELREASMSVGGTFGGAKVGLQGDIKKAKITKDSVSVDADLTTLEPIKVGRVTIEANSSVGAKVENNELIEVRFTNVGVLVGGLGSDKKGVVKGFVSGAIDVVKGEATGDAILSVETGFAIDRAKYTVKLNAGGFLAGKIAKNDLEQLSVTLDIGVVIKQNPPFELTGLLSGTYDGKKGEVTTGFAAVGVVGDVPIPIGNDKLVVKDGSKASGSIENSQLAVLTLDVGAEYYRGEALFLSGSIDGGKYDVPNGKLTGKGDLNLVGKVSFAAGKSTTITVGPGGGVFVDLAANQLEELKITAAAVTIDTQIEKGPVKLTGLFSGHYKKGAGFVEGSAFVTFIGPPLEIKRGDTTVTLSGSVFVGAKLADNELIELTVGGLHVALATKVAGKPLNASGHLDEGTWSKADGVTCKGGISLDPPGYAFKSGTTEIAIARGTAKLDVSKGNFQALEVEHLEVAVSGQIGGKTVGAAGHLHKGTFTPTKVSVDGDVMTTTPISAGPVTIDANSKLGATVQANVLTQLRFDNIRFEVAELGANADGIIEGYVSGRIDLPEPVVTGTATAKVKQGFDLVGGMVTVKVGTGGMLSGTVGNNILQEAGILLDIEVQVDNAHPIALKGNVGGTWSQGNVTGDAAIRVLEDLHIPIGGDELIIDQNSSASASVTDNNIDTVTIDIRARYLHAGELLLAGGVDGGKYVASTGHVSGDGDLYLKKEIRESTPSGSWTLIVAKETGFQVSVLNNALTKVGGNLGFRIEGDGSIRLGGSLKDADFDIQGTKFTGELSVFALAPFDFPPASAGAELPPGVQLTVLGGSSVSGRLESNTLADASCNLLFGLKIDGKDVGTGHFGGDWNLESNLVNASGSFNLSSEVRVGKGSGDDTEPAGWSLWIASGASVAAEVEGSTLTSADIDVTMVLKRGGEPAATGSIDGSYQVGDPAGFSGAIDLTVGTDIPLGTVGKLALFLGTGTHAAGQTSGGTVTSATGDFIILAKDNGDPAIEARVHTTYTPGTKIDGEVGVKLFKDILIGHGGGYEIWLSRETSGTVSVKKSAIESVSGQLAVKVSKGGVRFAQASFEMTWQAGADNSNVTATGKADIIKALPLGVGNGYGVTLTAGSGVDLSVTNSALDWITGKLGFDVDKGGKKFMAVELEGTYTSGQTQFTGGASLRFTDDFDPGFTLNDYKFIIKGGKTSASAHITNNAIDWVEGAISVHMLKAGGTILVELDGKYTKGAGFTGGGTATILDQIVIGKAGKFGFVIDPGGGLTIKLTAGHLDFVEGQLHGQVTWDGPFLDIKAKVTYRNQGKAEIDVDGSATILAAKMLVGGIGKDNYEFWLDKTDGPTAKVDVKKNDVQKVTGTIGLKIRTKGQDLITGSAEGTWTNADNKFTGEGELRTGRDLTFEIGTRIDILKGSGGFAKVAKSELHELKGDVKADIYEGLKGAKLFHAEASGHYDAVTNDVITADGSVTLMKPWVAMGGQVILSNASGSAKIRHSKLTSVEGSCHISLPKWGVEGELTRIKWSCETGTDVYEGAGWITANFLGGKVHGKVEVLDFKYGGGPTKFHVKGDITYKHNEYFKGTLGIEITEALDPVLNGKLELTGNELYPGRTLIDKKFVIVPKVEFKIYEIGRFAAGCDAAFKVALRPLVLDGFAEIEDFHPIDMKVPKFDAGVSVSTGVDVSASLHPYISAGLGLGPLSAGFKLKGRASLDVPVEITAGVGLHGDGQTFGGDVTLGATVKPSITLGFQPVVFAACDGLGSLEHPLAEEVKYTFPDLFVFEWSKTSTFGDAGPQETDAGGAAETVAQEEAHQESEAPKEPMSNTGGATSAPPVKDGQAAFGEAQTNEGKTDGEASEMEQKLKAIQEIAEDLAKVAELIGFVMDVADWMAKLSFLGPVGMIAAVVIVIIDRNGVDDVIEGVAAFGRLLVRLAEAIWQLMPDWVHAAWAKLQALLALSAEEAAREVANGIREWGSTLVPAPYGHVIQPLVDWAADFAADMVYALKSFDPGDWTDWLIFFFDLVTSAASGILSLFSAIVEVIERCLELLRTLVREGNIVSIDCDTDDFCLDPYGIYINIPYIFTYGPEGPSDDVDVWAIGQALDLGISALGVEKSHSGYPHDGWDHRHRFV